eukprot:Transcript_27807.p2 GENE.Transcript_27807~~Transcript_27807.p2  ORF type:complete len:634 (+),score=104.66 Transcript_27807:271-1902(+)
MPAAIAVLPKKIAITGESQFIGLKGSWGGLKPKCTAVFLLAGSPGCGGAAAAGSEAGGEVSANLMVSVTPAVPGKYKLCLSCPPVPQPPADDADFERAPKTFLEVVRPATGYMPTPAPQLRPSPYSGLVPPLTGNLTIAPKRVAVGDPSSVSLVNPAPAWTTSDGTPVGDGCKAVFLLAGRNDCAGAAVAGAEAGGAIDHGRVMVTLLALGRYKLCISCQETPATDNDFTRAPAVLLTAVKNKPSPTPLPYPYVTPTPTPVMTPVDYAYFIDVAKEPGLTGADLARNLLGFNTALLSDPAVHASEMVNCTLINLQPIIYVQGTTDRVVHPAKEKGREWTRQPAARLEMREARGSRLWWQRTSKAQAALVEPQATPVPTPAYGTLRNGNASRRTEGLEMPEWGYDLAPAMVNSSDSIHEFMTKLIEINGGITACTLPRLSQIGSPSCLPLPHDKWWPIIPLTLTTHVLPLSRPLLTAIPAPQEVTNSRAFSRSSSPSPASPPQPASRYPRPNPRTARTRGGLSRQPVIAPLPRHLTSERMRARV